MKPGPHPADVQFEIGERSIKIVSLLGFFDVGYPQHWRIAVNQQETRPGGKRVSRPSGDGRRDCVCRIAALLGPAATLYFFPPGWPLFLPIAI